ncbi:MAG: hypothetical protein EBT20_00005, partial [Alphaproteobacteria bacterium]|nr:hypothetical protein [Alphaproteobacteria bacterium]
ERLRPLGHLPTPRLHDLSKFMQGTLLQNTRYLTQQTEPKSKSTQVVQIFHQIDGRVPLHKVMSDIIGNPIVETCAC